MKKKYVREKIEYDKLIIRLYVLRSVIIFVNAILMSLRLSMLGIVYKFAGGKNILSICGLRAKKSFEYVLAKS